MKKQVFCGFLFLALSTALFAAGQGESKKPDQKGPIVLKVMDWSDSSKAMRDAFNREFEERNPGIKIEYTCLTIDQYKNTVLSAVSMDDAPDLFPVPVGMDLNAVVKEGWFQLIDPYVPADFKSRFLEGTFAEGLNVLGGKLYSIPETRPLPNTMVFYNRDLFVKAGLDPNKPPKTYSEFRDYAKKITAAGKGKFYGIIEGGQQVNRWKAAAVDFADLGGAALPSGDPMFSPVSLTTGKAAYNSPAMLETFKFFKGLADDGSYHPSTFSIKAPEARALFGAGQAGFIIQGVWCIGAWAQTNPDLKIGVAPAPIPDSGRVGSIAYNTATAWMGISAKTAHPEAAAKYLEALFSSDYGFQRANVEKGIFFSPVVGINDKYISNPNLKAYYQVATDLSRTAPNPKTLHPETAAFFAEYKDVTPGIGDLLQGVVAGAINDPEGALNELNAKTDQAVDATIKKVGAQNPKLTKDDFVFKWNPMENYK